MTDTELSVHLRRTAVSTLVDSSQVTDHLQTDYVHDSGQFSVESRPGCVRSLYGQADLSPVEAIRSCDQYRTDGRSGSQLFLVSPVVLREERQSPDLGATHKVVLIGDEFDRKPKELHEPKPRPHSFPSTLTELDIDTNTRLRALPTPEEKLHTMSSSQPASLVAIDVSGTSFERLCNYRVSLRSVQQPEYGSVDRRSMRKKRNRRKTVSGVSGVAFDEVNVSVPCLFGTNVPVGNQWQRHRPCSIAFDHYAPRAVSHQVLHHGSGKSMEEPERPTLKRSSSFRKSLRSLFRGSRSKSTTLWVEDQPRSPGPPVVDLHMAPPVRRSRSVSLTKSLRSVRESFHKFISSRSVSTDRPFKVERGSTIGQAGEVKIHPEPEKVKKPSRMQRIGKKLGIFRSHSQQRKAGGNESPMTRSRSMDMSTVNAVNQKLVHAGIPTYRSTMALVENHVVVPPDQTWIHRFADVKLRDNLQMAAHHENRQSSSGNWSGSTDSARQSLTSDCTQHAFATVPECSSEASLDKDSAVSLTIHFPNDRLYSGGVMTTVNDDTSTFTGGATVATDSEPVGVEANFTKMSRDDWLKNLNTKCSSSCKVADPLTSVLTQQNLIAHDQSLTASKGVVAEDDGGSSVYSVDQDGYYTSMHRDSGLARGGGQSSNGSHVCGSTPTSAHCIVKSKKNPFFVTNTSRGKTGSQGSRGKGKKTPPPPPPRVSTIQDKGTVNKTSSDSGVTTLRCVGDMRRTGENVSKPLCVMSPVSSDMEEDYASEWQQQSVAQTGLKSTMTAPGCLPSYVQRNAAPLGGAKMDCIAEVLNESSADQSYSSVDDCMLPRYQHRHDNDTSDGYSTWPRSPRTVVVATKDQAEGILKNGTTSKHHPPQTLNFAQMVNIFDETNTPTVTCCGIPQVRTPDDFLAEKRGFISTDNSFRDMPSNVKAMKYGMSLSRETPSGKYQHCVTVSPRIRLSKDHHARQNVSGKNALLHRAPSFQGQADMSHDCNGCDNDHMSTWPRLRRQASKETSGTKIAVAQTSTEPVAAPARLIISSHVAGRAEFVENPHKRVLCSPVTTEDLIAFSTCTSPKCQRVPAMKPAVPQTTASHLYHSAPPEGIFKNPSPTVNEMPSNLPFAQCSAFKPVSVPLFPSLSAMKHSIPFPVPDLEKPVERTPITRSWYDGMHTKVSENPLGEHNEVLRTSLLKDSADSGVTMRPRRDSNSSTMSTHSSSSSRRSVTFATVHRSSSSSLVIKLDHAVSSSLLCVPEQVTNAGVKRSRSMCSSSSESSWRHKYAPASLCPGVAPPVVPTFTTFTKPEPEAKRIRVGMETHKPEVDEPVVTQAYQFQVAPASMSFTGFASLKRTSLIANAQPFSQQKVKPKVPQRDSSFREAKAESQQLPLENCLFSAPQEDSVQPTTETVTLTGNTFVRSYAPPTFLMPKRDTSSGCVSDTTLSCGYKTVKTSCNNNIINNQCSPSVNGSITNGHAEDNQSSSITENGNCAPTNDIARGELSSHDVTQTTYSARLAFLSKPVTDARSVDLRFSEYLSASCSSLRDHGGSGTAKDTASLGSNGDHVSSMQGLCHGQTDTGIVAEGDIKGDDQSDQLVSPAVSSLSSSGLGSSVASSPDSRPNSPELTDKPSTGEGVKQSADVCCKT